VAPFDDLKPVKKFTNRKAAVSRVWQAIARLSPDTAEHVLDVAPAKGKAKESAAKAAGRRRAQMKLEGGGDRHDEASQGRDAGEATGWQKHTVRGFVSILGSKGGQKIESSKNAAGERSYRIAK